ncbi:MAG: hypothetical protein JSS04_02885 [Proteobacteria bacterium]|nr:hypothetical protein [Pseudomonadota bacterium]
MRCALLLALLCMGVPWRAMAQPFDGEWTVQQICDTTQDGVRGFTWRYPATVKDGYFAGQYRTEGQIPSMSLKGLIKADGTASLVARGISSNSDYTLKFAPPGTPIAYEVIARFSSSSGNGERVGGRVCKFTFSKAR